MLIRDATLADLPAIVAIYNATVPGRRVTSDLEPVTVAQRLDWFHGHDPKRRPLWVAEIDGEIAGYISFRNFYGKPAYHITSELGLYIADAHQRKGLGTTLLNRAIAESPRLGLENLLAFIFGHNDPSLILFKRHGFTQWGLFPGAAELDGVRRDLVILGLKIGK